MDLPLEFYAACYSSMDINIPDFGGHVAIFGCRSLLQLPQDTFELAMVETPSGIAVHHTLGNISISGIPPYYYFRWSVVVEITVFDLARFAFG